MTAAGPEMPPDEPVDRPPAFNVEDSPTDLLASIGQRIVARLIDGLVLGLPLGILYFAASDIDQAAETIDTPLWVPLVAAAVSALYEVVLVHLYGQTVGKRVMGIKVVRVTDGELPDWTAAIVRYLLPTLPALVPIPGVALLSLVVYLSAVPHPLRRGWHDRAAGTVVIRAPSLPSPAAPPPPPGEPADRRSDE